ncbi:MAG: asparagine synthase (glutamine-hydrolyzing) [Bacteroidetes bacterium]|nr:MAG: asparagine synthase (glutamine-hydrolyzing) [Bacteroidota bacterium]
MCGIVGYSLDFHPDPEKLLRAIKHRGPDGSGFHQETSGQFCTGLGHQRLSILDLTNAAAQPMKHASEKVVISFNGEIYNFRELKAQFLPDTSFKTQGDTEVILELYLKLGTSFVEHLNGDFAIAILDHRIEKLYLLRDRMGVKPLYYCHNEKGLVFASEIKALFELEVPREVNQEELLPYLIFKYSPEDRTMIRGVKRLTPAHVLEYDLQSKKRSIAPYWELRKIPEYIGMTYGDAEEKLRTLLEDAIRLRLVSDVPLGAFLSGGLDSSIIAHHLRNEKDIRYFCAVKEQRDLQKEGSTSDGYFAQKLANEWRLDLHQTPIGSKVLTNEYLHKTLLFGDDLIADGSQIPSYLISQEAVSERKVLLSGMGADEIFLGYAGHQLTRASQLMHSFPGFVARPMARKMAGLNQGKGRWLAYRRYLHKLGKYAFHPHRLLALNIVGDYESAQSLIPSEQASFENQITRFFTSDPDEFDQLFHFEQRNFLHKNLNYMDRMSMAHGVETRVPFLDHRLVEFAYALPRHFKLSNFGNGKRILKSAYREQLPAYIVRRRKAGFGMPLRSIFSDAREVERLLNIDFFSNFNQFSIDRVRELIQKHLSGQEDHSALIYALISFQHWYGIHIEQRL